jgi:hypothetical protein
MEAALNAYDSSNNTLAATANAIPQSASAAARP